MEKKRILVVEDNPDTRRFLEAMLSQEFEIITAENGIIGIEYARNRNPDLILLDITLPILNGHDACSLLKKDEKTKRIPIIFLSAKNTTADITLGLGLGADDYLTKPFDFKELLARIKTHLRKNSELTSSPIIVGDLKIDPTNREVFYGTEKISLTLTEFDILRHLATHSGNVVSREEILNEVWRENAENTSDRTIDVHVRAIRKKIPALARHITSVYGIGYKYS
jgi:two-component system, OmpR family, alkaline phosphatase synthesis response regulator PhoP